MSNSEIAFQVWQSPEGGYKARAVGYDVFTEAEDWEKPKYILRDAVLCHFEINEMPQAIRIHVVHNEVIPV